MTQKAILQVFLTQYNLSLGCFFTSAIKVIGKSNSPYLLDNSALGIGWPSCENIDFSSCSSFLKGQQCLPEEEIQKLMECFESNMPLHDNSLFGIDEDSHSFVVAEDSKFRRASDPPETKQTDECMETYCTFSGSNELMCTCNGTNSCFILIRTTDNPGILLSSRSQLGVGRKKEVVLGTRKYRYSVKDRDLLIIASQEVLDSLGPEEILTIVKNTLRKHSFLSQSISPQKIADEVAIHAYKKIQEHYGAGNKLNKSISSVYLK